MPAPFRMRPSLPAEPVARERWIALELIAATVVAALLVRVQLGLGSPWASLSPAVWIYLPLGVLIASREPLAEHGYALAAWCRGGGWLLLSVVLVLLPAGLAIAAFRVATGRPVAFDPSSLSLADALLGLGWVVVPEELFFRGYAQARWNVWARARGNLAHWAPIVLTASLFAFAHVLVEPSWERSAVFISGLAMSWLREKSAGMLAPAGFHWLANLLWASFGEPA